MEMMKIINNTFFLHLLTHFAYIRFDVLLMVQFIIVLFAIDSESIKFIDSE